MYFTVTNSFSLLLLFLVISRTVEAVKIKNLHVPEVIQLGNPVVLDCDYMLEADAEGLVVKWFFNQMPIPIYQWIPTRRPQDFGIFKGRLNLEYSASKDSNSMHRALHIIEPGPDLSGEYTCLVSTFKNEESQTKKMLVFAPEKSIELKQKHVEAEVLQVLCTAEGVFPAPNMSLLMGNSEVNGSVVIVQERAGLYNIKASANVSTLDTPEEFSCELHIPEANYTVRIAAMYYPSNGGNSFGSTAVSFLSKFMPLLPHVIRLLFGTLFFQ